MKELNFNHSNQDFFTALDISDIKDFLKNKAEMSLRDNDKMSQTILELIGHVQVHEHGEKSQVTQFELMLMVGGFLLGSLRQEGNGGINASIGELLAKLKGEDGKMTISGKGSLPDFLKKLLTSEDSASDEALQIAIKIENGKSVAIFKGQTDGETGMAVQQFLIERTKK